MGLWWVFGQQDQTVPFGHRESCRRSLDLLFYLDLFRFDFVNVMSGRCFWSASRFGCISVVPLGPLAISVLWKNTRPVLISNATSSCWVSGSLQGLVERVGFGIFLSHGPWFRWGCMRLTCRLISNFPVVSVCANLFAPCQHVSSCLGDSLRGGLDFEKYNVGKWFWDDPGRDLGDQSFWEDFENLL